ncbi:MAG: DUF2752 domain-containing protein [Verrucomicrobiales bacterium]|jgi:hypothetical protein|nr:DUF2752 domain-containing protein [Verrucomicrobiales bacterium]
MTRDAMLLRLGLLFTVSVMVAQTVFMARLPFLGALTKGLFQRWFGLPCPLCGGTRAMNALFHGDLTQALYLNWLALPVAAAGLLIVSVSGIELVTRRAFFPGVKLGRRAWLSLAAMFMLLWGWQVYQALHTPKPELLNRAGLFFKFYKFPETR